MTASRHDRSDESEYVGAPTEFADAQEVPEWVTALSKALFVLPATLVTAATIPLLLVGAIVLSCIVCGVLIGLV